jgi:tetratricopeptide (TPR) repeat protein
MQGRHILIIDDSNDNLNRLESLLHDMGLGDIVRANGTDEGWVTLKKKEIDCVVCAWDMKEMSGLALLKIIRKEDLLSDIPFFLTDPAFTKMKVLKAGQTGVTGLFVIPFEKNRIQQKIIAALGSTPDPVIATAQQSVEKGRQLIEKKQYKEALDIFTTLVEQKDNPEYYFNIGYIKTSQGKHSEAIEAFSMATRLDRLFARAYEEMGRAYKLMGNHQKAEEYMQLAAEIYMDTNKLGAAEDILNEILESGTQSLNVFNTLGVVFRKKGDPEQALKQYKKALKVHPDEPYIYYNIGRLYLDMKKIESAKSCFEQALEKEPLFDEARQVIKAIDLGIV